MSPDDPRRDLFIKWHPAYAFGEPTICNSAIKAEAVASLVWAGDSVEEVAEDYGLTVDQIRLACWWSVNHNWEARVGGLNAYLPRRDWADRFLSWAGGHSPDNPGNPPAPSSAEGTPQ